MPLFYCLVSNIIFLSVSDGDSSTNDLDKLLKDAGFGSLADLYSSSATISSGAISVLFAAFAAIFLL